MGFPCSTLANGFRRWRRCSWMSREARRWGEASFSVLSSRFFVPLGPAELRTIAPTPLCCDLIANQELRTENRLLHARPDSERNAQDHSPPTVSDRDRHPGGDSFDRLVLPVPAASRLAEQELAGRPPATNRQLPEHLASRQDQRLVGPLAPRRGQSAAVLPRSRHSAR